jgi:hypothetical protein
LRIRLAKVKLHRATLVTVEGMPLRELEAFDEFGGDARHALLRRRGKRGSMLGMRISENDPDTGTVGLVAAGTDGASELCEFERQWRRMSEVEIRVLGRVRLVRRVGEEIHEDAAGVVEEVAKALRDEDSVHVPGRRLFELVEIVIGEGIFEGNFDGSGRLICVGRDADGHGG